MDIVIVTGMSGAGKTSALSILQDLGYYSMDNLPAELIIDFANLTNKSEIDIDKIAVGLDIRGLRFSDVLDEIKKLQASDFDIQILFCDARDEVLVQRFKEQRRPHPIEKSGNLLESIQKERKYLEDIRAEADYIIDTSDLKIAELKDKLVEIFTAEGKRDLVISVVSFGFKYGILLDADLVFDIRFLPNPHYLEDLRHKTGQDQSVVDYIFSFDETKEYSDLVMDLLNFSIPLYKNEGKSSLVIGIGCTGGKHRSVAFTEHIASLLKENYPEVYVRHRDERNW